MSGRRSKRRRRQARARRMVRARCRRLLERGPWWGLFNDPVLADLAGRVEVSNQKSPRVAAYSQARALVPNSAPSLFPRRHTRCQRQPHLRGGNTHGSSYRSTSAPAGSRRCGAGCGAGSGCARRVSRRAWRPAAAKLASQGELGTTTSTCASSMRSTRCWRRTIEGYARTLKIAQEPL